MWSNRKLFFCLIVCTLVAGGLLLVRLSNTPSHLLPEFIPGARRFRLSRVCAPLATILVNSAPPHTHRRQVIRETWGHPSFLRPLRLSVAFGIGLPADPSYQRPIDWEAETFGDVFQIPLRDEYRALKWKILGLLELALGTCVAPRPQFFLKTDDDVFVNIFALSSFLEGVKHRSEEKIIFCLVWEGMPVVRTSNSKWYLSRHSYGESLYPTYCSGAAYVMSAVALDAIVESSNTTSPIPSEDVHVTGVLAKNSGVKHVQLGNRYSFESTNEDRVASGQTIFAHLGPGEERRVEELWNFLLWKRREKTTANDVGL